MWIICRALIAISIATVLLACDVASGDYCKWTDENGVVHYADECPESSATERVEIEPPPARNMIQEAQRQSEALASSLEISRQEKAAEMERQTVKPARVDLEPGKHFRCVDAMVDLHNLQEGEAMYFDENGKLHDQFSIHSSTYSGERTYLGDSEHKALIQAKQEIVLTDCVQSRDEIITRIKMLAERSDSQMCRNLHDRVLEEKKYDRKVDIAELQSIERTVLEVCN